MRVPSYTFTQVLLSEQVLSMLPVIKISNKALSSESMSGSSQKTIFPPYGYNPMQTRPEIAQPWYQSSHRAQTIWGRGSWVVRCSS